MTYTLEDYDELDKFLLNLMGGGTGYFRGIEVRCELRLGAREWTMYGPKVTSFVADVGPDDLDYTREKLMAAGILDASNA